MARERGHAKRNPRLARERVIEKRTLPSPHTLARRRFRLARKCPAIPIMRCHRQGQAFPVWRGGQTEWRCGIRWRLQLRGVPSWTYCTREIGGTTESRSLANFKRSIQRFRLVVLFTCIDRCVESHEKLKKSGFAVEIVGIVGEFVFHEMKAPMIAFSTRLKIRNPSLLLSSSGWKTELEFGRRIHLEGIHL